MRNCVKADVYKICLIIMDVIFTIGISCLVIFGVIKCHYMYNYPKIFIYWYYINCILWIIVGYSYTIGTIIVMDFSEYCSVWIIFIIGLIATNFGYISLYILFYLRLQITFPNTISKSIKILLYFGIPIMILLFIISFWYFLPINNEWSIALVSFGLFILTQYIFSGIILCLYIRNIFNLLNSESNKNRIYSIIYLTVKYFNCFSTALFTSFIGVTFRFIRSFNDSEMLYFTNLTINVFDAFINCLALNLQFNYMDNIYQCIYGKRVLKTFQNVAQNDKQNQNNNITNNNNNNNNNTSTTTDVIIDELDDTLELVPTRTSNENAEHSLQPMSQSYTLSSTNDENASECLYLCRLCPVMYK